MKKTLQLGTAKDTELVELCLNGQRDAFEVIIIRYQSLICALAYSACGDRGRSQDLAQDTFVTAWKKLAELKEPARLKGWLCGIVRHLANSSVRRELRMPAAVSEPVSPEARCDAADPHEQAVSKEEEALVWQSLQAMPTEYREPLVLFYREGQSARMVAAALDLTEEAVWQRLSRGRAMLKESVARTVDTTLLRTAPGKVFTLSVLAALPALSLSAKAATVGVTTAKGSATAKAAFATGMSALLLGQSVILFGNYYGYRSSITSAQTDEERETIRTLFRRNLLLTLVLLVPFAGWLLWEAWEGRYQHGYLYLFGLIPAAWVIYILVTLVSMVVSLAARRKYLANEAGGLPAGTLPEPLWEYRSRWSFLGLPLVHIRIGDRFAILRGPVKAWIAAGNHAIGGLFAFGGLAIAPLSIGFCAIGLLPFGAVALGLISLGGVSLGGWAFGGLAVGWQALGGFAVGWQALGGCALAWNTAIGDFALAHGAVLRAHASSMAFIQANWFFRAALAFNRYWIWWNLLWVLPLMMQARILARQRQRQDAAHVS
jgi:RNA polymerase sigma factor (sigma-70 family)